jgi:branched-chain amino acid transport system ATP-binding protein
MLEIKQIDVFYGDVQVIWDVSFEVKQGEIVALIGANGAGKSTILKTISGMLRPRKGEILFEKNPIYKIDPYSSWNSDRPCP